MFINGGDDDDDDDHDIEEAAATMAALESGSPVQASDTFINPSTSPAALKACLTFSNPSPAFASLQTCLLELGPLPAGSDVDSGYCGSTKDGLSYVGASSDQESMDWTPESDLESDDALSQSDFDSLFSPERLRRGPDYYEPRTQIPFYEKYLPESWQYKTKLRRAEEHLYEQQWRCEF
jgi:hypothetical protein